MKTQFFLPDVAGVRCDVVRFGPGIATLKVIATESAVLCPDCGQPSRRVHSRTTRILSDLPWMGTPVRLHLHVRRFFCDTPTCPRGTFSQSMAALAQTHARKTCRLAHALC